MLGLADIDAIACPRQILTMFRLAISCFATLVFAASNPLAARTNGNPDFRLTCGVGSKLVEIATEDGRLVYRFGKPNQIELQIRENRDLPNVFYRYDLLGAKGSGQRLRFTNGRYSYGIASWFIAGAGGDEGVAFFILKGEELIMWRKCQGDDWFTEDNQLSRLPHDPFWVSSEGVETGEIPGVTPVT